jgi:hypothetical protein
MTLEGTSFSPMPCSSRSMAPTTCSNWSAETGRFSQARVSPLTIFSRSNASRRPSFFTMSG